MGGKEPEKKGTVAQVNAKPAGKEAAPKEVQGKEKDNKLLTSHTNLAPPAGDRPHTQLGGEEAEKYIQKLFLHYTCPIYCLI